MTNLEVKTRLTQDEAIERLKRFFGIGGLGLDLTEAMPQCLTFEGGGGYVTATICPEAGNTRINLVTQEWDYQVTQFAEDLP